MLRTARLLPLVLPALFAACQCDTDLGHVGPQAVLVHDADKTPPLDILKVGLDPTPLSTTAQVDFTLENDGNLGLLVQSVTFGTDPDLCPTPSGAFSLEDAPTGPFTVKQQDKRPLTVVFAPTSGSPGCTILEVHSNDADHPVVRALITGQGDAPQLCTDRQVVDFGQILVGDTKSDTVHLTSCGTRAITITDASLNEQFPDPFGAGAVATGQPLAPGDAVDIPVTFSPQTAQTWSIAGGNAGVISLLTDAPGSTAYQIDLVGSAKRPPACVIKVDPGAVQFGNIGENRTSTVPVSITNIGELPCNFSSATVREPAGDFSVSPDAANPVNPGDVLQPQQSGIVDVTFAPTAVNGQENGFLDVVTDDPVNPTISVPLEGTSVEVTPCFLEAAPTAVNFGVQPLRHQAERTVTLTNVGTDTCTLKNTQLTAGAPDFSVVNTSLPIIGTPITAGGSVDIVVHFKPQSAGAKSGNARLTYKQFGFGNPDQTLDVPLSGDGQAPCFVVTPTDLDFLTLASGAHADRDVTLSNCGGVDVTVRGISLRPGSDPGFAVQSAPAVPMALPAGASATVTVRGTASSSATMFGTLQVLSDVDPQLVNLHANGTCSSGLVCQPASVGFGDVEVGQTLVKSLICSNPGTSAVPVAPSIGAPFTVVSAPASIPPGGQGVVRVAFSPTAAGNASDTLHLGASSCQGAPINTAVSGVGVQNDLPPCPHASSFDPQLLWNWDGGGVLPTSNQVWGTALVSRLEDTNGDGAVTRDDMPRVVFLSYDMHDAPGLVAGAGFGSDQQINDPVPGVLRAVDGATGHEVWTAGNDDPSHRMNSAVTPAIVDLDGDGCVDIVAEQYVLLPGVPEFEGGPPILGKFSRGNLIAFDCHGKFKWISDEWTRRNEELEDDGGLSVGDVDGDGFAEIADGDALFDHNGRLLWQGGKSIGSAGHGVASVLADVDGQPGLELVAGPTVYRADGSVLWDHTDDHEPDGISTVGDGLPAVADLDGDGVNEVVVRGAALHVYEGPTGAPIAGPRYPVTRSGMQGPDCDFQAGNDPSAGDDTDPCNIIPSNPAIFDIDHDGKLDIVTAGQQQLDCYDKDLNPMWRGDIFDGTGASGPVGFDFEADGYTNVVFADESTLWSWNSTGQVVFQAPRISVTMYEYPSVADIDNDKHANFLIGSNDPFLGAGHGLKAYEAQGTPWAQARGIWNQHPYLEQLVSELGTPIPNTAGSMPYPGFRTATPQCTP